MYVLRDNPGFIERWEFPALCYISCWHSSNAFADFGGEVIRFPISGNTGQGFECAFVPGCDVCSDIDEEVFVCP